MSQRFWKILDTRTGWFHHEGGAKRKLGKVYQRLSDLVNHVKCCAPAWGYSDAPFREWRQFSVEERIAMLGADDVVIEYELVEVKRTPLREFATERVNFEEG